MTELALGDVFAARNAIRPIARRTPLIPSAAVSRVIGATVYHKLETLQTTGSFKVRGAANKLVSLGSEARERGVVTFSTGNHGRAVAHVGHELGCSALVCVSELVPESKIRAIELAGGKVSVGGRSQDEAAEIASRLVRREGLTLIDPLDDPRVIAGQGTIGLEILEDLPDVETVLVPVSGGGLIAGVALALRTARPDVRIIGISMEHGAAMYESQKAGRPVAVEEVESLADNLGGGIALENRHTFHLVRDYVDDLVLVSEEEIGRGMAFALDRDHLVVEGAAAVGIAALLHGKVSSPGRSVVVLTGNSVDSALLFRVYAQHAPWLAEFD